MRHVQGSGFLTIFTLFDLVTYFSSLRTVPGVRCHDAVEFWVI